MEQVLNKPEEQKSLPFFGIPRLFPYLKKYRKTLTWMVICGLMGTGVDILMPLLQRYALNHFITQRTLDTLPWYILFYVAAIARMLTRPTPIMIFDDSLSAVDTETDAKIRKELEKRFGSATIILISHRITTLSKADQVLVLDHGRVAQLGTPEELSKQEGLYKEIETIQADSSESLIRETNPLLQESVAASGSEAGTVNDDRRARAFTEEVDA